MLHFSKLKTQEDFFFCLSASLQLLLCTAISEWDRNATGRLFIVWPQKSFWILQVHCRYHSQTTQSIHAYNLLNNNFSTPREPTTDTKGRLISRHTSITEHMKTDSSTWIIPEGIKTSLSKQHLTSQLTYFRFLYSYFLSAVHGSSALDHTPLFLQPILCQWQIAVKDLHLPCPCPLIWWPHSIRIIANIQCIHPATPPLPCLPAIALLDAIQRNII